MDALEALYTRRSVRRFKADPVERSQIEQIVDAGRLVPTANNFRAPRDASVDATEIGKEERIREVINIEQHCLLQMVDVTKGKGKKQLTRRTQESK